MENSKINKIRINNKQIIGSVAGNIYRMHPISYARRY